jgi:hypothetical protein
MQTLSRHSHGDLDLLSWNFKFSREKKIFSGNYLQEKKSPNVQRRPNRGFRLYTSTLIDGYKPNLILWLDRS